MNETLGSLNCISMYAELRTVGTQIILKPPIRRARFVQLFYVTEAYECGIVCDLLDENDCYSNVLGDVELSETEIKPLSETNLLGFGKNINDCPIFELTKENKDVIKKINFKVITISGGSPSSSFNLIVGLKIFQERGKLIMWPRPKYTTLYIEIRTRNTKVKIVPPIYDAKFLQMFYMTSSYEYGMFCDLVDEINSYSNIEHNKITDRTKLRPSTFIGFGKSYDYPVLEITKGKGDKVEEISIGIVDKEGSRSSLNIIIGLKIFQ